MKAFRDTKSYSFNMGVIEALNYFGGVPKIAVPDNDKSAVIKASKYSPIINEEFKKLATYYNFVVSPARVRSPRDKPVVENTVFNAAERQLIGASHNETFSSFSELEKFVYNQLEKFNEKPFQKKEGTRKSVFEKEDKPVLNPLPKTPYEIIISKKVIVGIDYHVQYNHKYYSVPYTYRGKEVMLNIAGDTLKIFSCDDLIATHLLIKEPLKRYSTLKEHMPEKHKALIERSKDNYLDWAKNVNESVYKFVEKLFSKYKIEEQAYRSLAGFINFCNKDKAIFIKAIETAIDLNSYSYYCVKTLLTHLFLQKIALIRQHGRLTIQIQEEKNITEVLIMNIEDVNQQCKKLKLASLPKALDDQENAYDIASIPFLDRLYNLFSYELASRKNKKINHPKLGTTLIFRKLIFQLKEICLKKQ